MSRSADDIRRLFQSASEILVGLQLRDGVVTGAYGRADIDGEIAIDSPLIIKPHPPTTRETALPEILLRGPFKGAPTLHGVAFYIGIGFITVREVSAKRWTYEITGIDGDGGEERLAFLIAARDLFFNDAKLEENHS
jgi:hypothetical protein